MSGSRRGSPYQGESALTGVMLQLGTRRGLDGNHHQRQGDILVAGRYRLATGIDVDYTNHVCNTFLLVFFKGRKNYSFSL